MKVLKFPNSSNISTYELPIKYWVNKLNRCNKQIEKSKEVLLNALIYNDIDIADIESQIFLNRLRQMDNIKEIINLKLELKVLECSAEEYVLELNDVLEIAEG